MRTSAALCATLAWLFLAPLASAETEDRSAPSPIAPPAPGAAAGNGATMSPAAPPLVVVPTEADQPALEAIPSARDTLGGHFVLGASAGAKWAFGSHSNALGAGLGLNLDLGYGLGRNLLLGAWGEFDSYSAASGCNACSGKSFAGGPFLRYHLVQGTRFDPWGALAVGVRSTTVDIGSSSASHVGPEYLKLTLGGDWYVTANVGIGPYVTFDLGSYGTSSHSGLGTGLRLVLDLPGK